MPFDLLADIRVLAAQFDGGNSPDSSDREQEIAEGLEILAEDYGFPLGLIQAAFANEWRAL